MKLRRERRRRRTDDVQTALRLQLEACGDASGADAAVVSDEHGLPIASVGSPDTCGEIAARLPMLGRKAMAFDGVLLGGARGGWKVAMRKLLFAGSEIYVALIGAKDDGAAQVERGVRGVERILAT